MNKTLDEINAINVMQAHGLARIDFEEERLRASIRNGLEALDHQRKSLIDDVCSKLNQIAQSFTLDDLRDWDTLVAISRILNQNPHSLNDFVWSVLKGSWISKCDIKPYNCNPLVLTPVISIPDDRNGLALTVAALEAFRDAFKGHAYLECSVIRMNHADTYLTYNVNKWVLRDRYNVIATSENLREILESML